MGGDSSPVTGQSLDAAAAGAAPSSAKAATAMKAPFLLPCGHTFCEPCVLKWLESHAGCPVCRKPVAGAGEGRPDPSAPSSSQPRPTARAAAAPQSSSPPPRPDASCQGSRNAFGVRYTNRPLLGQEMYLDEFAFRMAMMRRRYPQYITPAMQQDMVHQAGEGASFNWAQHRDFQARNPELRAERERQGASSSSFSFGGGRSAGGSGSSW